MSTLQIYTIISKLCLNGTVFKSDRCRLINVKSRNFSIFHEMSHQSSTPARKILPQESAIKHVNHIKKETTKVIHFFLFITFIYFIYFFEYQIQAIKVCRNKTSQKPYTVKINTIVIH